MNQLTINLYKRTGKWYGIIMTNTHHDINSISAAEIELLILKHYTGTDFYKHITITDAENNRTSHLFI